MHRVQHRPTHEGPDGPTKLTVHVRRATAGQRSRFALYSPTADQWERSGPMPELEATIAHALRTAIILLTPLSVLYQPACEEAYEAAAEVIGHASTSE